MCMYIIYIYIYCSSLGLVTGLNVLGKNTTLESLRLVHAPFWKTLIIINFGLAQYMCLLQFAF